MIGELNPETTAASTPPELNTTQVKDTGLQGYWRMESNWNDTSANGYTLTAVNTPTFATGMFGNGGSFVRASSQHAYIAHASCPNLTFGSSSFSLFAWVKPGTANAFKEVISKINTGGGGYNLDIDLTTVYFGIPSQSIGSDGGLVSTTAGVWNFIGGVVDRTNNLLKVYCNGVWKSAALTGGSITSTSKVGLGCDFQGAGDTAAYFMDGMIDDAAAYSRALSESEVAQLYHHGPGSCQGLWHLNGNSTDSSGNGNNGTDTAVTYSLANGKFSQGAGFNGSSSKIVITDAASLKPTGNFTINGWIKTSTAIGSLFCSISANTAIAGFYTRIENSGKLDIVIGKNTGTTANVDYKELIGNKSLTDGIWHNFQFVYNGSNIYIYVDGNLDNSVANTINPAYAATNYPRIGCQNNTGTDTVFLTGNLDELALYSRAWTAAEIRKYYAWTKGRYT